MRQAQALDNSPPTRSQAAGMTAQRSQSPERIKSYAGANGNPSSSWRFSPAERKVLLARLPQLKSIA
jgi:hypothetical protein